MKPIVQPILLITCLKACIKVKVQSVSHGIVRKAQPYRKSCVPPREIATNKETNYRLIQTRCDVSVYIRCRNWYALTRLNMYNRVCAQPPRKVSIRLFRNIQLWVLIVSKHCSALKRILSWKENIQIDTHIVEMKCVILQWHNPHVLVIKEDMRFCDWPYSFGLSFRKNRMTENSWLASKRKTVSIDDQIQTNVRWWFTHSDRTINTL